MPWWIWWLSSMRRRSPDRGASDGAPREVDPRPRAGLFIWCPLGQVAIERAALDSPVRSLDGCNVDLLHPQHGLHGGLGSVGVGVADHFVHGRWNDLPGHAVFVL